MASQKIGVRYTIYLADTVRRVGRLTLTGPLTPVTGQSRDAAA